MVLPMLWSNPQSRRATLRYQVDAHREDWNIEDEESVPQSRGHQMREERVAALLKAWAVRSRRNVQVGQELALRWDEDHPRVGVDPDVYVVEPPPPEGDEVLSLRTWETGHHPPLLAIEIVSPSHPNKDYGQSPEKYAASGTYELWVFDPYLHGRAHGGPFRLQVWRREEASFDRVYAGDGPVYSKAIDAWVIVVDEGRKLAIADDEAGTSWWMTREEEERAAKETERAAKETERAAKEQALAENERLQRRLSELEALLAVPSPSRASG